MAKISLKKSTPSTKAVKNTAPVSRAQQIADVTKQAQNLQKTLVKSVKKGQIAGVVTPDGKRVANSPVSTIKAGSPVISSTDRKGEYDSLSSSLDVKDTQYDPLGTGTEPTNGQKAKGKERAGATTPAKESTGDPLYDSYLKQRETESASSLKWAEGEKKKINDLLPQTLGLIDNQYKASMLGIQATYSKLIDTQTRINQIDIDRTKAYGVQNGGQYMPLEMTSAVSSREQNAANEIAGLENERTALIGKAKTARTEGRLSALRTNMEDITKIEDRMRTRTADLQKEVQTRFELATKAREEKEKKHLEKVKTTMQRATIKYQDEFDKAKTPEEKDKLIKKILLDSGGTLTEDDYYSVYSGMATASADAEEASLKKQKAQLDIQNVQNTIYNRNRSTEIAQAREARLATADETEINLANDIDEAFDGEVGGDGYASPSYFKEVMKEAQTDKMKRTTFLEEYGHLMNPAIYKQYGLTQAEIDKLSGI